MTTLVSLGVGALLLLLASPAYAGQGWYLLEPPLRTSPGGYRSLERNASIHMWTHVDAFDTARECRTVLETRGNDAAKNLRDPAQEFRRVALEAALDGRCIASDDPRLKP